MAWKPASRSLTLLALLAATFCTARSQMTSLPATSPTAAPVGTVAVVPENPAPPPTAAVVHYADGKLQVTASGSGLNEILDQIARVTSITISGRVNEEPVFGSYGPATIGDVLSELLDGTGCNMLLRESSAAHPGKLILTPRSGGAFNSAGSSAAPAAHTPPRESYVRPAYQYPPPQAPGVGQQAPVSAPYVPPQPASYPAPQPAGAGASPNSAPLSPEQIYQQLQRIQQSQPHP